MTPGRGLLRLTRTAFFAVSAVGLASAAHLGSGERAPAAVALLSVPAVMLVTHLLAATRRGPVGLVAGMGLTQIVLHLAFMVTSTAATCMSSASMAGMTGMASTPGHGHVVGACEPVGGPSVTAAPLWPSASMALAHTLATVLLVLLLARGEAAVWALAACLRFRLVLPGKPVLLPASRQLPVAAASAVRVPTPVHLRTMRRRGPPVPACAVL